MKGWWLLPVALGLLGVLRLLRRREQPVSEAWRIDQERRRCGLGVDQVCISWPIQKLRNESPIWNRRHQRNRA